MAAAPTRRRRLEAEDRRAEIVEVATRLIAQHGFRGLTVQGVADGCGMTVAGLLHHMGSKDGILVAVLEHRDAVDGSAAAALADGQDNPRAFVDALVLRNSTQPEIVRLYSVLGAESLNPNHPAHQYFGRRYDSSRRDMEGIFTGHVPDPAATAVQILAVMDGLQLQWLRDPEGFDLLDHWRRLADKILDRGRDT